MTDTAQVVSAMLQAKWGLSSPKASDIFWATTRFTAMQFGQVTNSYAIACYNPGNPVASDPLSREVWQMLEDVIIDIVVKTAGMSSAGSAIQEAIDARESMRQQVYSIIHQNEFAFSECADVYPLREQTKAESPELVRLAIQVKCKSFSVQS
ncbi:MAG: hypothetical protein WCD81_07880 [Candidatus Bathyarchaeia archaeon]